MYQSVNRGVIETNTGRQLASHAGWRSCRKIQNKQTLRKDTLIVRAASNLQKSVNVREMQNQFKVARKQMEENEEIKAMMQALRGSNFSDAEFADKDVVMQLVEVTRDQVGDELPLTYDPELIKNYWMKRPVSIVTRIFQLLRISGGFLSKIASDIINKKTDQNQVARAIELRQILTSLGPAYIKLGQALSIRPDVLGPGAMNEMQKLCDKVPSFPSNQAMQVIEQELGKPYTEVYATLSPEPIAAASLGQVYKGTLKTGEEVAVKVQRPYVLETVTIDLYIIRTIGLVLRNNKWFTSRFDVVALLDEWANGFFRELDYVQEGLNGEIFAEQMKKDLPQVVVPKTFHDYTSRRVLTTGWIVGEKLAQSKADDVGQLVNIGVVCYLKQLLETGLFHADPHPGNLFRTPDGRLGILDFGLMVEVDSEIKFGIIEAISHLIHRDYDLILNDFVTLKFIPPNTDLKPILPTISKVLDQALEGGGAKNINFQELAADLAQVTFDYPFQIPPYFALIIRAIGVLEGIALSGNPDFAIIDEAYPYVAKRLLTDKSPRLQAGLKYMLYGRTGILDADRLIELLQAFEDYNKSATSGMGNLQKVVGDQSEPQPAPLPFQIPNLSNVPVIGGQIPINAAQLGFPLSEMMVNIGQNSFLPQIPLQSNGQVQSKDSQEARVALRFLFSEDGEVFRDFILNEIVKSVDALSRDQLVRMAKMININKVQIPLMIPGSNRKTIPLTPELTQEDHKLIANYAKILTFLSSSQNTNSESLQKLSNPELLQEIAPYLPKIVQDIFPELSVRLASRIGARVTREIFFSN